MMRRLSCLLALLWLAAPLAGEEPQFRRAVPGYVFEFPRDHGAHPEFRTEWWYYTGNVFAEDGTRFGFKLTFFRTSLAPPGSPAWQSPLGAGEFLAGHFAITNATARGHHTAERIGRPGLGQAHASTETLDVRLGTWMTRLEDDGSLLLRGGDGAHGIDLRLTPAKPFIIHGRDGAHQKSAAEGQASHYITFPRLAAEGTLTWAGRAHTVRGYGWMDHEFGSDPLSETQLGWDWFAIQLENGEELMVYQIREEGGGITPDSVSTLIRADGTTEEIPASEYRIEATGSWRSPRSRATYPMGWRIHLPRFDSILTVTPVMEDQEMDMRRSTGTVYWEGAVDIGGTWRGQPARGMGYVELVGYDRAFRLLSERNVAEGAR